MKREERLALIKQIISENKITTQEELQSVLESRGVKITQASLSRDIRELHIIKKREDGKSFYVFLTDFNAPSQSLLHQYFTNFVLKVDVASVNVVVHTHLGEADVLANAFDDEKRPEILGTLAGADTLLLICKDEQTAKTLAQEIEDAL
ncbi:arginine repressor [Lactococcus garvieae]|jgi:transcriptional regulator of arginine metabolism|uniref:arginine repressor n=1 Tax=Lactococcus garvieae TaxID=1363 RepID=UPI0009C006BF|nr:arginine repressor [Lactococcus garvieae]QPS70770.1 arginine repressor [Lactococcus garvieae]